MEIHIRSAAFTFASERCRIGWSVRLLHQGECALIINALYTNYYAIDLSCLPAVHGLG